MKKTIIAKALNLIGILLMLTVILIMVPLTVPKAFGVRIYGVLTGSMTPAYSVGGVVYVMEEEPQSIQVGDVVTYTLGSNTEYVMTHRVVEITDAGFITKGDANNTVDPEPVLYERLIGKVVFYLPGMSGIAQFVNSSTGRYGFIMLFAMAFICWVVADIINPSLEKEKGKTKKGKRGGLGLRLAGGALFTGALVYLVSIFLGYRESAKEYASLEQVVFEQDAEEPAVETENTKQQPVSAEEKESLSQEDRKILQNIASLHEENEDVIGWIRFDTLDISYPIMQCMDNEYYLNHTFSGEENSAGSIFMEAANTSAFEDSHTIIYGHNMKNGSMFGSLKNYKTKDFYGGNEYFKIYTLESVYRYQIFAYYDISMYGDVYNIQYGPDESFGQFIDNMVKRSYYDTGVRPEYTDKILTLSTCSTEGNRFVVNAVRISN